MMVLLGEDDGEPAMMMYWPIIFQLKFQHVEAGPTEQAGQRSRREVRTMFVVDIPKCRLGKHAEDVGKLEEHQSIHSIPDGAANRAHEALSRGDVLESMAATYDIRLQVGILLAVEILNKLEARWRRDFEAFRNESWIDPYSFGHALLDHLHKEFSLAASNLQNALPLEMVLLDPAFRQAFWRRH